MIDLHCHLLHGIDDGPDTLAQSLELCRMAAADGITHAVVTPHIHPGRWGNTRQSIDQACSRLQVLLDQNNIPLLLGFAGEVRLTDRILQQIASEEIPFYGEVDGYQIMLLEFPHSHVIPGSQKLAKWLLGHGIRPLIAHPERNRQIMRDGSLLQPFLDLGCWLQVTGGAVTGDFGEMAQSIAHQLLDSDQVAVLASDGHNTLARPPVLSRTFDYIAAKYGIDRATRLMLDTPAAIVGNQQPSRKNRIEQRG
jgi:protein-tyrosine phosphatase